MQRPYYLKKIIDTFKAHPVVGLLGPRQSGKSTLAKMFSQLEKKKGKTITYFDLEDDTDLQALQQPQLALESLKGLVIIDEIQRLPNLFPRLRVLVDKNNRKVQYLILGSASRELIRQGSETLAGRIDYVELMPFSLFEADKNKIQKLWVRGGFPLSYLAQSEKQSQTWRKAFIKNFLERDIPSLGLRIPPGSLRRFWLMLAHYHGQILNASEIGKSLGIDDHTVRRYLDILAGTFMIRQLQPWHENISKRQVKSPKIYFRDSGLFHSLLDIPSFSKLQRHPKLGSSWEGFALEEIIRSQDASSEDVYFWGTHNQAELDLMILKKGKRIGYEVKYTTQPKLTRSMHIAMNDLKLNSLKVVFPGKKTFPLGPKIDAIGIDLINQRKKKF